MIDSLSNIALLQVLEIMGSLPETVKQMTGVDITGRIQAVHWNVSKYKNKEYRIIYNILIALHYDSEQLFSFFFLKNLICWVDITGKNLY